VRRAQRAPVRTTTPTAGSLRASSKQRMSSVTVCGVNAFRLSGRFMVICSAAPRLLVGELTGVDRCWRCS